MTSVKRGGAPARSRKRAKLLWAELMRRSFGFDPLVCARCGGRLRLLAIIETAGIVRRILAHLGLPTEVPAARPSRAPPLGFRGDGLDIEDHRRQWDDPA